MNLPKGQTIALSPECHLSLVSFKCLDFEMPGLVGNLGMDMFCEGMFSPPSSGVLLLITGI